MSSIALEFKQVSFRYDEKDNPVVNQLSFKGMEGEFISIIGPSGSGKSTLFRLISGLEDPEAGEILIQGKKMQQRLGSIGYMPQKDLLMPWRTILANAGLPLEIKGYKKEQAHQKVSELLGEFGLQGVEHKYPHELSGGMRQRVSFLRSILTGSPLLLLDEPFSALDAITRVMMQEWLLGQWEKWKKTVLFITHDVDEALFLSDRIFVLTKQPIAYLEEIRVPLQRPRSLVDLSKEEIVVLKQQLIQQLRVGSL